MRKKHLERIIDKAQKIVKAKKEGRDHLEIVKASKYYGRPTPGYCVLINGVIHLHLFGKHSLREARESVKRLEAIAEREKERDDRVS